MRKEVKPSLGKDKGGAGGKAPCQCPFCDAPIAETKPFCIACGTKIRFCPDCKRPLEIGQIKCPSCGR